MSLKLYEETDIKSIANAIRSKTGTTSTYTVSEMSGAIESLSLEQPLFADSIEELNTSGDTTKKYVLPDGYIYEYKSATTTQEIETPISGTDDNPYTDDARFSSSGAVVADVTGWVVTPYIDITQYTGTIKIKLSGVPYIAADAGTYGKTNLYKADKSIIVSAKSSTTRGVGLWYTEEAVVADDGSCVITLVLPWAHIEHKSDIVGFLRFCGQGTSTQSVISVVHTETVTANQWVNTGVKYSTESAEITTKVATLNNEGDDPTTITLLPSVVKAFYQSTAYSDDDYTTTHLGKITYPCRADIPVPYTVKWNYNESAMRTTVAVDTKAIGTSNAFTLKTYDATGLNKFPLYNLIPNKTYYYKITHVLSDGSLVEAKSGNFTTASEPWRLLYIDGTQNVRDIGGWNGLNNKKVKYGRIIRGAALSDSSFPDLIITGQGKLALAELNIQAELNLGAIDNSTSIAANCAYKKIGYSNYADAITSSTARANFKTALEWVVSCLDGTLNETGLYQVQRNIYVHCQGGCDRTGTFVFLLLGLLGVSESDLAKEYELSSFSNIGYGRLRNTVKATDTYDYSGLVAALKQYNGTTITDKFYSFATNETNADKAGCGISADTITSFRNLMLE